MTQSIGNESPKHNAAKLFGKNGQNYFVKEPLGKRGHSTDSEEYAPKAKRRFERVNAKFEQFSISREEQNSPTQLESSSDEDMIDDIAAKSETTAIVEEPEEFMTQNPRNSRKFELDTKLQQYLEMAKKAREPFLPRLGQVRGDEITLWSPRSSINPFDDPSMNGRIQEVSSDFQDAAELPDSGEVDYPDELLADCETMSQCSSVLSVPKITELSDSSGSNSPTSSQNDVEYMDLD